MAEDGRRVDLRCGAFACSISGYDDPAAVLEALVAALGRQAGAEGGLGAASALIPDAQTAMMEELGAAVAAEAGLPTAAVSVEAGFIIRAVPQRTAT